MHPQPRSTSNSPRQDGVLFIVCGPSGVGKSSLGAVLRERRPRLTLSVSWTTRAIRAGEQDGVHYSFVDAARFEALRDQGGFAEWATVHGNMYGTPISEIERAWAAGHDVLFDIDYQGAKQLQARFPGKTVSVLLVPPNMAALEARLRGRGTDSEATIARRMAAARHELEQYALFDFVLINDDRDETLDALTTIYDASQHLRVLREADVRAILGE
jgi:guanylate kinase